VRIAGDAFGQDEKTLPDGRKVGQGSWEDVNRTWAASGEDPWSTYRYAGAAAHLAYCLELARVKDPEGIDWGKEATQAYAWAQQNTRPGDEQKQPALREPRAYAAAALFRITDDKSYERQFAADTAHINPGTALWEDQQYGPIVYALSGGKSRPDSTLHVRIRSAVLATADILAPEVPSKRALRWGGNWYMPMLVGQQTTPWMLQAAAGHVITRDKDPAKAERYLAALYTTCDYFLGCNALNMTWATGLGPRHPKHVFHMDAWYNGKSQFHPGIIPYGPWRKEKDQGQGPWDAAWPYKTVYPAIDAWPANERWFDNRCSPLNSEFTVHQNIAPAAALFGFLCSESAPVPATASRTEPAKVIDLRPVWDTERVLRNPYKGWYHHYYDNGTRNYRLSSDDDLDRFPGMDHLYIRLSWAHFEPEEGRYDWSWIDEVKDRWMPKGYGISLRISTCETGEPHATPEWVIAAGAKGAIFKAYRQEVWVPDYDDPIFLAKLDRLVGQLAKRYDGQPWLRYVDIGLGTWGEGHNFPMFDKPIPMEVVKRHIDLYRAHFRRSVLVLSDDAVHVHGRTPEEEKKLKEYANDKGISWRDDSILTWPGLHNWPDQFNVARPKLFESAWRTFPTVLETSHYHEALRDGAYKATSSGGIRAYEDLRGAIQLTHATYLGYHGDARKWLSDHPDLAKELANKLGYWYFPKSVAMPQCLEAGRENTIQITWENRGTAPAYQRFTLRAQLAGKGGKFILPLKESNNLAWMPGSEDTERYGTRIPGKAPAGRYAFSIALLDTSLSPERMIELGLKETLRGPEGFYRLCEIELQAP
jgi:hypothetical protein